MEFYGKIISISEVEEVGAKNTPKQTFVLEEDTTKEFKGSIAIDLLGEKVALLEGSKVGHFVTARLNVRTTEYQGKVYNNITAWRIDKKDDEKTSEKPF
jgi:hypothetical protein